MMGSGNKVYPVLIKEEMWLVPKEMKWKHIDVFKAIFNNKNVVTTDENEIEIEI